MISPDFIFKQRETDKRCYRHCWRYVPLGLSDCRRDCAGRSDTESRMLCMLVSCKSLIWACFVALLLRISHEPQGTDLIISKTYRQMTISYRQIKLYIQFLSSGAKSKKFDVTQKIATLRKMSKIEFLQERVEEGVSKLFTFAELGFVGKLFSCRTFWKQMRDRKTI